MTKMLEVPENHTVNYAAGFLLVCLIGFLLIAGRSILIPFVIAIFIWHLINTIFKAIERIPVVGTRWPAWLRMILALVSLIILCSILANIISSNVNEVIKESANYQAHLTHLFNQIDQRFHIKVLTNLNNFIDSLSMRSVVSAVYSVFTLIMSSATLIGLYVIFLFVEQHYFSQKVAALFHQRNHQHLMNNILVHIINDTQTYLGIKTLTSILTAAASWVVMKIIGLDFAEFWALLIFFLNYIPNIGAIIATAFPSMLALIQFQTWLPFIVITSALTTIQFIVGNLIEPRFLGKSLNLSPLVMLIALALWGAIWGVIGMFLAVPITVMMMIIFAHFEKTRGIAILLSQDGLINRSYEKIL